ncbi:MULTISPECIES: hypothetical protein [Entomomonas]|uniref:Uncharacterized protein n=1 Tax=Entomomonas asaccharolytica TaxID=2785331 RepID=A0A974RY24_9GAMM|nr:MULTISPECIES: hypothetical protein [Entomomonas]QQP86825.1 hypothetical protein JHT90_06180 [Entomomonas asaccharolytica]UYZ83557.1 hypothetical protein MTZ49_13275 [Entomomonas sp. E2T0]
MADLVNEIKLKSNIVKLLTRSSDPESKQTVLKFQEMIVTDVVNLAYKDVIENNHRDLEQLDTLGISKLYELEKARLQSGSFAIAC